MMMMFNNNFFIRSFIILISVILLMDSLLPSYVTHLMYPVCLFVCLFVFFLKFIYLLGVFALVDLLVAGLSSTGAAFVGAFFDLLGVLASALAADK